MHKTGKARWTNINSARFEEFSLLSPADRQRGAYLQHLYQEAVVRFLQVLDIHNRAGKVRGQTWQDLRQGVGPARRASDCDDRELIQFTALFHRALSLLCG